MGRLKNFDYKSPYYYMVTLKGVKGLAPFSEFGENGLVDNEITRAFKAVIKGFSGKWRCLEEISPWVIMPDHLHLIVKIADVKGRVALGVLVSQLSKTLRAVYWGVIAADAANGKTLVSAGLGSANGASAPLPAIFEREWHDWIVKKAGQLAAFRRYIKENPERAILRRQNAQYFGKVTKVNFLGREWLAYGNCAILDLPVLVPFKGHRVTTEGSHEWTAALEVASRLGPGCAGVSTFMSPLEKAYGNAIAKAGGKFIVLSPESFGERWHPPREKERFCARGRMLFLSLYEPTARKPTKKELYERCHEMIDLVVESLPGIEGQAPK